MDLLRGEPDGVVDEVAQGLRQALGVGDDLHGLDVGGDRQGRLGAQAPCLDGHEVIEVDVDAVERDRSLIGLGEQE